MKDGIFKRWILEVHVSAHAHSDFSKIHGVDAINRGFAPENEFKIVRNKTVMIFGFLTILFLEMNDSNILLIPHKVFWTSVKAGKVLWWIRTRWIRRQNHRSAGPEAYIQEDVLPQGHGPALLVVNQSCVWPFEREVENDISQKSKFDIRVQIIYL